MGGSVESCQPTGVENATHRLVSTDTGNVDIDSIHHVLVNANDQHIANGDGAFLSDSIYYFNLENCWLCKNEEGNYSE